MHSIPRWSLSLTEFLVFNAYRAAIVWVDAVYWIAIRNMEVPMFCLTGTAWSPNGSGSHVLIRLSVSGRAGGRRSVLISETTDKTI